VLYSALSAQVTKDEQAAQNCGINFTPSLIKSVS
jgi:protein-disulfide isomerase